MTDAASSRRTSAKPRDGAYGCAKASGLRGLSDLDPVVGNRGRRRWRRHQRGRHTTAHQDLRAVPARPRSTGRGQTPPRRGGQARSLTKAARVDRRGALRKVHGPLTRQLRTGGMREDVSPENIKGTIDGGRPGRRLTTTTFDQRKCSHGDEFFARLAPRPRARDCDRASFVRRGDMRPKSDSPEGGYGFAGVAAQAAAPPQGKRTIKNLRPSKTALCTRHRDCSRVSNLPDFGDACAPWLLSTRRHDPDPWRTSQFAAIWLCARNSDTT